ncbi:MAG: hypothetical protein M3Y55_07855, partial [Pseudomonadota bacterium]|nr:hypothetical protein [Pseudomonadota bacterium]
ADRLGAIRFVAIAPDGKRTNVSKEDGVWHRPEPQLVKAPAAIRSEAPARDAPPTALSTSLPQPDAVPAKIDADVQRAARVAKLEADLNDRYLIKRAPLRIGDVTIGQTEYRHRGDTSRVAFTESTFRLSTDTNSPSVARSMVDVAEARNWQALRVSGNEDFKRMVWLEASVRNVRTVGYEPVPGDQDLLRKEREARQLNRIERQDKAETTATTKQSARGGGRKAVLAALEAVLVARHVPEAQREAVMAVAAEKLTERLRRGETHRVKIYDNSAPSQRPQITPPRDVQRPRERASPTR